MAKASTKDVINLFIENGSDLALIFDASINDLIIKLNETLNQGRVEGSYQAIKGLFSIQFNSKDECDGYNADVEEIKLSLNRISFIVEVLQLRIDESSFRVI